MAASHKTMTPKQTSISKLTNQSAVIGIIGLGYVGLPLAIRYSQVGYQVLGFDIDPLKKEKIAAGQTYFKHIPDDTVQSAVISTVKVLTWPAA